MYVRGSMSMHFLYMHIKFLGCKLISVSYMPCAWVPNLAFSQVYSIKWHMGHYGAASQKPQRGWTNNASFQFIDLGPWRRADKPTGAVQTVRKTINKRTGRKGYCGTAALKESQSWPYLCNWCRNSLYCIYADQVCKAKCLNCHAM